MGKGWEGKVHCALWSIYMHAAVLFAGEKSCPVWLRLRQHLQPHLMVESASLRASREWIVTEILGTSKWRMGSTTADPRLAADC